MNSSKKMININVIRNKNFSRSAVAKKDAQFEEKIQSLALKIKSFQRVLDKIKVTPKS